MAVSVRHSGTYGRASLWRLSQSSSPHKCRSHLGFSLALQPEPWSRLDLWPRLRQKCLGLDQGPLDRTSILENLEHPAVEVA